MIPSLSFGGYSIPASQGRKITFGGLHSKKVPLKTGESVPLNLLTPTMACLKKLLEGDSGQLHLLHRLHYGDLQGLTTAEKAKLKEAGMPDLNNSRVRAIVQKIIKAVLSVDRDVLNFGPTHFKLIHPETEETTERTYQLFHK